MITHESKAVRGPGGQSLLEFALVLPMLLLVIFGVLDLGFAVYAKNTVALAAREGARAGIVFPSQSDSATRTAICNQAVGIAQVLNLTCAANITILPPSPNITHTQPIIVTVVYTYTPLTPFIGGIIGNGGLPLRSESSMTVE
jgi:Flp pilus assembly protein TadG